MKKKLLVVDDEPLNVSLLCEMLGKQFFNFFTANSGQEAVETAMKERLDMIIMDWQMPGIDGLEALKILKASEITQEIPVLMVTGVMNSPENLVTAMDEGAIDFLRKPFDRLELKARVRNMLLLSDSVRELKEKYSIIARSNNLIKSLFQGVPHPLVYYSIEGLILQCNPAFEELAGKQEEKVIGTLIYRMYEGIHYAEHLQRDTKLINEGGQTAYEGRMKDDHWEYIFSKHLLTDDSGVPLGIICVMTDITELKDAHSLILEGKKRELISSALRLINISEINNNLIAELGKLQTHVDEEGKQIIEGIVKQNNITTAEGVWQDFETRFEKVYESFYNRLNEKFPDLTPGEKKLCALLRLNISSKDIAAITLQNPQSVDMARYRLRKKMNLSPEDNLVDFLLKVDQ